MVEKVRDMFFFLWTYHHGLEGSSWNMVFWTHTEKSIFTHWESE